jgi:hypothetical protein
MTIDETLLQKLASWRPDSVSDRLSVDHAASGWQVSVTAEQVDTLGCRLRDLTLSRLRPMEDAPPLAEQAERIAGRVTGLLEGLRLVEIDEPHGVAQLRSSSPARRGDDVAYYEVLRHGDGTTRVNRYHAPAEGKRQAVPFNLTHEALGKLVGDLAAI